MTYFNEIDPFCVQWLRNQFGEVDERDIRDIAQPTDAVWQHYFAGLGGWQWALKLAGWPEDREIWTGSVPCQPWSVAGRRQAAEDARDLWPAFLHLITLGTPAVVIGEQVTGAIAYGWLDRICDDLEGIGYAVGATVLPASGVGAPHIRERLYWVAVAQHAERRADHARHGRNGQDGGREEAHGESGTCSEVRGLDDAGWLRNQRGREARDIRSSQASEQSETYQRQRDGNADSDSGETGGMADDAQRGQRIHRSASGHTGHPELGGETIGLGDSGDGRWPTARHGGDSGTRLSKPEPKLDWASSTIYCSDGKWRRIPLEPSFLPLADGGRFGNPVADSKLSSRIAALRASGNAICIPLGAEFIRAVMDIYFGATDR